MNPRTKKYEDKNLVPLNIMIRVASTNENDRHSLTTQELSFTDLGNCGIRQNKTRRRDEQSAPEKYSFHLLCLIHAIAPMSCYDGYTLRNRRLQSQPKGRPIHVIQTRWR